MNALLLSAGEGTRLRPLTLKTPKCLLPFIKDKPILQYWLDTLAEIGIETIFINVFHLKNKIIDYVDSLDENMRNRIYLYQEEELEPVGMVLSNLRNLLGSPFLIVNSDTYVNKSDVKKFIRMANPGISFPVFLGVEYIRNVKGKGKVLFDRTGLVIKFEEKPKDDIPGYAYAGIMCMDSSVVSSYKKEELVKLELTKDILSEFKDKIMVIELDNVVDIGDGLETYRQAYKKFTKNQGHLERIYLPNLDFTGGIYGEHFVRYLLATRYAVDKAVLDLGCGTGYGMMLLSYVAKSVIGVDYWLDKSYIENNLSKNISFNCPCEFKLMDLNQDFITGKYDLVVAFEILEHLKNPEDIVKKVANILNQGGKFIFSIPNELKSDSISIYHNYIFSLGQIKELVGKYFNEVEWFGQRQLEFFKEDIENTSYFIGVATL